MPIASDRAKELLTALLKELVDRTGVARTDRYSGLRAVDAKVREVKMILKDANANSILHEMEGDSDFAANSRRVRLEALANYCKTALRFFDTGLVKPKKELFRGPNMTRITGVLPELEPVIQERWLEAQRCQHAGAYLASVIIMGSILEALLLARCSQSPSDSYQANAAPKDKAGKNVVLHDWSLHALIEVSVERGWLKTDRGGFSHALRESRNIVHPYAHARNRANFDETTCKVCWQVLNASADDLIASV